MCTVAKSKKNFGWLIKIIQLPFFFFFFFHASLSHSVSSLKLTLSTPVSLSTLVTDPRSSTQAQSLNSGLTLSTLTLTHEARRRSECLTGKPMELAADRSACLWILVVSHHQLEIWVF